MAQTDDRTEHSPADPQWRWRGVNTDIRTRPTPNELDEMRRTRSSVPVETAVRPACDEVAMLAYGAGISRILAARVVALEARVAALEAELKSKS